ncbi:Hypothetical_protein [Hexamita inflata]|uniref:Hypothetical_protein n=1 Tax=Hexamita inflata TaxID=28002 RepID=A0AA86Q0Y9_9EUKA|nr:Hypothetical protein HINF_LOCUS35198 [Hexamita inflata]
MFFMPILIQEFLQGILWLFVNPDDTPWTCSILNKRFSTGFLVVQAIPVLKVIKDNFIYKSKNKIHLKICCVLSAIQVSLYIIGWIQKTLPMCTTIGPHGHQIWNFFEFLQKFPQYFGYMYLIIGFTNGFFSEKVDISFYIELDLIAASFIYQLIFHYEERLSRWCWSSSIIMIAYIFDPQIVAFANKWHQKRIM